jgi:flagellar biosynthetic protein FliQ
MLLAAPLLLTTMIVGLVISLLQTVTSIKDMTMTLIPKLVAMGVAGLVFGNWMMQTLVSFTLEIFNQIQTYGQ